MVVKIFDSAHTGMRRSQFLLVFFKDFPYEAKDFESTNFEESPENPELRDLFTDLGSLSLLMIKNKEENDEIKTLKVFFKDKIPFQPCNKTKFEDLDKRRFSAVFFPIETGAKPEWGMCVRSDAGDTFFFDSKDCEWKSGWSGDGDSYKLAEALANKLLESELPEREEYIFKAAKNWIVTGDVDENGKVKNVGLGNKLDLPTKRKFIVPDANYAGISIGALGKTIRFADTVEAAWNHVTDQGTKNIPEAEFPPEIDELHVLVGGNIKAQVASIIFSNPKKVFLWYSESVEDSRKHIEYVVKRYMKEFEKPEIEIEMNLLSSKSMAEAERTLKGHFDGVRQNETVIFNVTSGNRIMSYAVQTIARAYRNVELIYRDIDEPKDYGKYFFTRLIYNEFPPYSGKMWGKIGKKINVDFLCGTAPRNDTPEDFAETFYNKLIKKEANDE
ncbi:hypothetical protein J6253_03170 [bacterium]|nr:hypothetical protein [bacterium]MBP5592232.1 hypothetical protein [bacterium]